MQNDNSCFANFGYAYDFAINQLEMVIPSVGSRVKKSDKLFTFTDKSSDITAFVLVAMEASISEIFNRGFSSVFLTTNMVNVKSSGKKEFWNEAVFTLKTSTK